MEIIEAIKTRRSVRSYTDQPVEKEKLDQIIEAGFFAPSSKNAQPWHIHVVKNKEIIAEIADLLINSNNLNAEPSDPKTGRIKEGFNSTIKASGQIIKEAPILLIIENTCPFSGGRHNVMSSDFESSINGHDSEFVSLGALIENISLAAHGLGLSSVIICDVIAEEKKIKEKFNIKGDLVAILPIGYPAYMPKPRRVEVKEKVTFID